LENILNLKSITKMSIQACNAKIAVVAATLLAEVDAHGYLNGCAHDNETNVKDDTPLTRHQVFSEYIVNHSYNNYVNGAENRVTRNIEWYKEGTENGWTTDLFTKWAASENPRALFPKIADGDCPSIWAGTEAASIDGVGVVNGEKVEGDKNNDNGSIGVCEYNDAGEYDPSNAALGVNTGCCGGWSDMKQFEQTLTEGGQKNTETGWYENGVPALDKNGNERKSVCWTMDFYMDFPTSSEAQHFGIPITNSTLPQSKQAALNVDNYTAAAQSQDSFKVYTAGDTVDLSWVSTQLHGGMVEYSIVCDGNESYENFKNNRLEFVECGKGENCGMYEVPSHTFGDFIRPNIISNGKGEKDGKSHWSFVPDTNFNKFSKVPSNAGFRTRSRIPASLNQTTENKYCTLAWFWWGRNSEGVFGACSDVIIAPAASGVRSN